MSGVLWRGFSGEDACCYLDEHTGLSRTTKSNHNSCSSTQVNAPQMSFQEKYFLICQSSCWSCCDMPRWMLIVSLTERKNIDRKQMIEVFFFSLFFFSFFLQKSKLGSREILTVYPQPYLIVMQCVYVLWEHWKENMTPPCEKKNLFAQWFIGTNSRHVLSLSHPPALIV